MEQIEQRNKMAAKPVFPLLMSMAFPPMLSMLVQSMYNIVDSMRSEEHTSELQSHA